MASYFRQSVLCSTQLQQIHDSLCYLDFIYAAAKWVGLELCGNPAYQSGELLGLSAQPTELQKVRGAYPTWLTLFVRLMVNT
jgi:hypothetical protein